MDTKALAKSKRAHSQHHSKKHHPNLRAKAPLVGPVGTSCANKPSGKQVREKPHESHGSSALPSNWDRYAEEHDSGSEDPSNNNMTQATDSVVPKSKGADYGHLISEAKSQSQTNISTESFPSFDDVLADFNQGVGSLLSVRGQSILSWTGDDNFVVEDRATGSQEASFLSLNLHLLAEQLEKVDLSQRLFIEPDILPPELFTGELETSFNPECDEVQDNVCQSEEVKKNSDELVSHDRDKMADQIGKFISPDSSFLCHSISTSSHQGSKSTNVVKDEPSQLMSPRAPLYGSSVKNLKKKPSRCGIAAADIELDNLLDSFTETKLLGSSTVTKNSKDTLSVRLEETLSSLEGTSSLKQDCAQTSRKDPDVSKHGSVATHFDDALDDLLEETSSSGVPFSLRQEQTSMFRGISSVQSVPAQLSNKGPDISKSASVTANFDDNLDELLKETSSLTNQKGKSPSTEVITTHLNTVSSSFGPDSKSKVLDDFDSWFDTM